MRLPILLALFLLTAMAHVLEAQTIVLDEDFEDQDLTQNPSWTGNLDDFTFTQEDGNTLLRLDTDPTPNRSQIATSSSTSYGSWEFFYRQQPGPSNANRSFFFLMADREDVNYLDGSNVSGYALRTGDNQETRRFRLLRFDNGNFTQILESETQIEGGQGYQIRVERSDDGEWQLFVSEGYGSEPEADSEVVTDNNHTASSYFGYLTTYSSLNTDNYFLDNIRIATTEEFRADQAEVSGPTTVDVIFNFPVDETTIDEENFEISEYGTPVSSTLTEDNVVQLEIPEQWADGTYSVTINNVESDFGDTVEDDTLLEFEAENPFMAEQATALSDQEIAINFSEPVDAGEVNTDDFALSGPGAPDELTFADGDSTIVLQYPPIEIGEYTLSIDAIPAASGWTLVQPAEFDLEIVNPFFVERVEAITAEEVQITFSEEVIQEDIDPANFEVENIGAPSSVEPVENNDILLLSFDSPFSGGSHLLTVSDITSVNGWQLPQPAEFEFFLFDEYQDGDVVINEWYYRVIPELRQDSRPQYIELHNTTDKYINIENWYVQRQDQTLRTITDQPTALEPNGYKVISGDTTVFNDIFGSRGWIKVENFPQFNLGPGSSDVVNIRTETEDLVDRLEYVAVNWGGDEVAIERLSPIAPTSIPQNWADSEDPLGGTPGEPNSVSAPEDPPEVESVVATQPDRLRIDFTRAITVASATDLDNYEISEGIGISDIDHDEDIVLLHLEQVLQPDVSYEITLRNLEDVFANQVPEQTISFSFVEFDSAEERDVVINEFLYRPGGGVTRFLELYNRSDNSINLQGWTIGRGTGTPITLPADETPIELPAGEHIVITPDDSWVSEEAENVLRVASIPAFSSLGDAIFIRNEQEATIDTLRYATSWGGNQEGRSAERLDPEAASNDPGNWTTNTEGHTAGFINDNYQPDEIPPELTFAGVRVNEALRVYFDQHIRLEDEDETTFSYQGSELEVIQFDRHNANTLVLESPGELPQTQDAELEVSSLTDVAGNTTDQAVIPIARALEEDDVVINEIMYQPISDRYGDRPDQSEYLEFYNKRPYAVSLEGVFIHDRPDRDDQTVDINPVTTSGKWIPAEGYAVMHGDPQSEFEDTRLARFFSLDDDMHVLRANRSSLSLSTQGDDIYLADSTRSVIDQVSYEPSWHNQNLADLRGRSLERKRPSGGSNDERNWSTTTNNDGGTPLAQNTLFSEPSALPDEEGITLDPDPFSPNADGRDDNLNISWQLDETDYLMRIRIYDRHGRKVRTLADGEQAGLEGTVTWDGMKDDGTENRVGFYIVLFEAYNSTAGSDRTFKETVVLAREM